MNNLSLRAARIRLASLLVSVFVAILLAAGIMYASFVISYTVLQDLARQGMIPTDKAHLFPLAVDGAILLATLGTVALKKISGDSDGRAFFVWLLFAAVAISVAGNAYHAYKAAEAAARMVAAGVDVGTTPLTPTAAAVIAVIPPLLMLAFTHGIGILIRGIGDAYSEYTAAATAAAEPADEDVYEQDAYLEEVYAEAPSVEFEPDAAPVDDQQPLLWDETEILGPTEIVSEQDLHAAPVAEAPVAVSYEPEPLVAVQPDVVVEAAPVEAAPVEAVPAVEISAQDGPTQTVAALLAFLEGANLHPVDKETARLKIEDPSLTFEDLAERTGGKSGDLAHRRYKRAEKAARAAGFTVPPLPVVPETLAELELAVSAA